MTFEKSLPNQTFCQIFHLNNSFGVFHHLEQSFLLVLLMDSHPSHTHQKKPKSTGQWLGVTQDSEWLWKAALNSWVLELESPISPSQLPRCRPSYPILIVGPRVFHIQWMLPFKRCLRAIQHQQSEMFCRASSFCREPRDGDGIEISSQRKSSSGLRRKDWTPCMLSPLPESKMRGGVQILHYFPSFLWAKHILVLYLEVIKYLKPYFPFFFSLTLVYALKSSRLEQKLNPVMTKQVSTKGQ